jgi:hypothetical protein
MSTKFNDLVLAYSGRMYVSEGIQLGYQPSDSYHFYYPEKESKSPKFEKFRSQWLFQREQIGGKEGGSCWSTENVYSYTVDPEILKGFTVLDHLILDNFPNTPFKNYMDLKEHIIRKEFEEKGYYGNSETYLLHAVNVEHLSWFLG